MRCIIFAQGLARFKCARRATAAAQDFRADSYGEVTVLFADPPRGSGLTCPARSDRIGARCHGSSALCYLRASARHAEAAPAPVGGRVTGHACCQSCASRREPTAWRERSNRSGAWSPATREEAFMSPALLETIGERRDARPREPRKSGRAR